MTTYVEVYSSYAYAVEPSAFFVRGARHVVAETRRVWRTPGRLHFYVRDTGDEFFELTYVEAADEWSVRTFGEACAAV